MYLLYTQYDIMHLISLIKFCLWLQICYITAQISCLHTPGKSTNLIRKFTRKGEKEYLSSDYLYIRSETQNNDMFVIKRSQIFVGGGSHEHHIFSIQSEHVGQISSVFIQSVEWTRYQLSTDMVRSCSMSFLIILIIIITDI